MVVYLCKADSGYLRGKRSMLSSQRLCCMAQWCKLRVMIRQSISINVAIKTFLLIACKQGGVSRHQCRSTWSDLMSTGLGQHLSTLVRAHGPLDAFRNCWLLCSAVE